MFHDIRIAFKPNQERSVAFAYRIQFQPFGLKAGQLRKDVRVTFADSGHLR